MHETTIPRVPKRPIDPRRAWKALHQLFRDQELASAFALLEAVGGDDHPTFARFLETPDGPRLLRERPSLVEHLADRASLAALPPGSLGRAYLSFAEENGIAAEAIVAAKHEGFAKAPALDPAHEWFFDRLNAMHDVWHVLSGYGTEGEGEALLVAFTGGAGVSNRGLRLVERMIRWRAEGAERARIRRAMREARNRGAASLHLLGAPYEEILGQPLEQVRIRYRIEPIAIAHPDGLPHFHVGDAAAQEAA